MSTEMSLSVMNASEEALFALSWMTCPSIHTGDIREMYSAILWLRRRTGHGACAVVSAAVAGSGAVVMVLACPTQRTENFTRGVSVDSGSNITHLCITAARLPVLSTSAELWGHSPARARFQAYFRLFCNPLWRRWIV